MINHCTDARHTGAMSATVELPLRFDPVADDLATAVFADWGAFLNSALKAVEDVVNAGGDDLERKVVVITAHFAGGHRALLRTGAADTAAQA